MIAQKMGSQIRFQSTPGEGSTFVLDLVADAESGAVEPATAIEWIRQCLVIDDNAHNRLILERTLELCGIGCVCCESGPAALKMLEASDHFDVATCVCNIPEVDGLETIRLIREQKQLGPD